LDSVRVLAVVAVVVGHSRPERTAAMLTFTWHVPVFFVLSGYLLSPGRDAATELSRRTASILVPTLAWGMIVTALWWLHGESTGVPLDGDFWRRLGWGGSGLGAPYSPFWFMPVLVVAILLVRLLDSTHRWAAWAVAVGGYLLCLGYPAETATSFWSLLLAPACMLYVLFGRQLRAWRPRLPFPFGVGLALLALAAFSIHEGATWVNIKQGSFGTPIVSALDAALVSIGLILLAESVFGTWSHHWIGAKAISKLAATSLPVILGHMLVLSMQPRTGHLPLAEDR
jgi:fucose 4-O-acetylase-like acetyltransferase